MGDLFGAKGTYLQAHESFELKVIEVFLTTHKCNKISQGLWDVGSVVTPEIPQEVKLYYEYEVYRAFFFFN